jgi:predicted O-methyltransferase YrrM
MKLSKNKKLRLFCGVLETMNLLTLRLALKQRSSLRQFPGEIFRSYMSLVKQDQWLSQNIFELFPGAEGVRVTLDHLTEPGIHARLDELARVALITKLVAPKKVFEIGTFCGRTALNFALNSPPDSIVYTLDLPPEAKLAAIERANPHDSKVIQKAKPGLRYEGTEVAGKIQQLYGDSQDFDFRPYFGKMDLVFVDGAHHYEAVRLDTINALKMVKPGGVILWDDFADYGDYNDVTRAVLDLIPPEEVVQVDHTHTAFHRPKGPAALREAA